MSVSRKTWRSTPSKTFASPAPETRLMSINLYRDTLQNVWLFGQSVLYTEQSSPREEAPEGWYCYDLCGTDRKPDQPLKLKDSAVVYRVGTVLSPQPLKKATTVKTMMAYY